MTIQEAQDIIKKIPDYCEWDLKYNKAEEVVRKAIKDGYQLCKVDEMKKNIKNKSIMMADCNYPLGDSMECGIYVKDIEEIIEEACE